MVGSCSSTVSSCAQGFQSLFWGVVWIHGANATGFSCICRVLPSWITESVIGWLDFAHSSKLVFGMGPATWELVVNDGKVVFQHVELSQTRAWICFLTESWSKHLQEGFCKTLQDRNYATGWWKHTIKSACSIPEGSHSGRNFGTSSILRYIDWIRGNTTGDMVLTTSRGCRKIPSTLW